jgi:DNA-binding NarL/FixJ family response regulator
MTTTEHEAASTIVRVVIVDDHRLFRTGVRTELADAADRVEVVGEAEDVSSATAVILATHPDVVLLDVHLPGGDGTAVIRQCVAHGSTTRFLALSVSDAPDDVIAVVRAGARGYVTKTITGLDLVDAISRVAGGDAVFSPRLAGFVLDAFSGAVDVKASDDELDLLSPREQDVMRLIARGYTYREVARELFLSVKTVEPHMSNVLRTLQLSNRNALARGASSRQLL